MISPPILKENDFIGIVSPSGKIDGEIVLKASELLQKKGFNVVLGEHVFNHHFQYAGKDGERWYDLQKMLDNPEIRAVLCSRGGYGLIRIVSQLDFTAFRKFPKWIIGFSDITVLHAVLNHTLHTQSIHGPMAKMFADFPDSDSIQYLVELLKGNKINYLFDSHPFNCEGETTGELIGGNLAILTSLIGTPYDFNPEGKILFIEDIGEYLYRIDRMMWQLKLSGKFKGLRGVIVGQFTDVKDNQNPFGKNVIEILAEHLSDLKIPVCYGFPAGHENINWSFKSGGKYHFKVTKEKVTLSEI